MNKTEVFKKEINYVKDENLRSDLKILIELLQTIFLKFQRHQQESIILILL